MTPDWTTVVEQLTTSGWTARVVAAEHLAELRSRVDEILASGDLPDPTVEEIAADFAWTDELQRGRSVVVAATPRPLTQATLTVAGQEHVVLVPPPYADYRRVLYGLAAPLTEALAPAGYAAVGFEPPLKTLAACAGLTRYGRNNIAYVGGLGSYFQIAACATDAPPPVDEHWGEPRQLDRCDGCNACLRACPTGAIRADRFLLHTDRCLTIMNQSKEPFPGWVDPSWHHCGVGCLRCQQRCPENARVKPHVAPAIVFDEAETAAILATEPTGRFDPAIRQKLAQCGLDRSPASIVRNLQALLPG
jgi:epoxyqueuosine reductase